MKEDDSISLDLLQGLAGDNETTHGDDINFFCCFVVMWIPQYPMSDYKSRVLVGTLIDFVS